MTIVKTKVTADTARKQGASWITFGIVVFAMLGMLIVVWGMGPKGQAWLRTNFKACDEYLERLRALPNDASAVELEKLKAEVKPVGVECY